MKNIKNILATIVMLTVLTVSTSFADGILVSNRAEKNVKTRCTSATKINAGILVSNIVGILVSNFTGGILVSNAVETVSCVQTNSGILISD